MCMLDLYIVFRMLAFILLLDNIDTLIQFVQSRNIFVSNFITILTIYEDQLYSFYIDSTSIFECNKL